MEEKKLYFFIVIVLLLIIFLVLSVFLLFNVSQKRILREVSKAQVRELEFSKMLLKNSIETQENERTRIARELHDGITSKLNVINLNINYLKGHLNTGDISVFNDIKQSVTESINLSREIAHDLIPPAFSKFGIKPALEDLSIMINRSDNLAMKIDIDHDWNVLPKMQLLHIFRIIQELVNNTVKHANATSITLKSELSPESIIVTYSDDGIGIKENNNKEDGIGIKNIKSRIKLLSAEILPNSENNETGYFTKFKIPYKNT